MPLIIMIAVVCLIVWGILLTMRGSLLSGCVVYLILTTCFSNNFFQFDIAGATLTLDRLFLAGLVVATVVQYRLGRVKFRKLGTSEIAVSLLLGLLILSTFTHDWRASTALDVSILMRLVNGFIIPITVFFIAGHSSLDQRGVRFVHSAIALFGIYLAITGLLEVAGQWSLVFPRYIGDPSLGTHFGRARGPALQSVVNGSTIVMSLIVLWMAWGWSDRGSILRRFAAVAMLPLFAATVFVTYTRSVWLGAGLAGSLILACTLPVRWRPLILTGLAGVALVVGAAKWNSLVELDREGDAAGSRQSTYMRASFAYVSWEMFKDHPLSGAGFGQFARQSKYYLSDQSTSLQLEAIRGYVHHNTLLCILTETGMIGFSLYLLMLATWVRNGWVLWSTKSAPPWIRAHGLMLMAAMLCCVAQMAFHDVTYSPIDNTLIFLLAGIAAGLRAKLYAEPTADHVSQQSPVNVKTIAPGIPTRTQHGLANV